MIFADFPPFRVALTLSSLPLPPPPLLSAQSSLSYSIMFLFHSVPSICPKKRKTEIFTACEQNEAHCLSVSPTIEQLAHQLFLSLPYGATAVMYLSNRRSMEYIHPSANTDISTNHLVQ
jgi:hypothetical protein